MPELTILMPCLNEARTVQACIREAFTFIRLHDIDGEVLIADNGSTDGSVDLAKAAGARVVSVVERGYGAALLAGLRSATGRFVIMGDSDGSYDFSQLMPFVEKLRNGAALVVGNRFKGGIEPGAMPPLHRYLGNPVLSYIGRRFFRLDIGDFHCGLRGMSRKAVLGLDLVTPGMEFASEMIAKAALAGLTIEEVPTTLRPDGRDRAPHLRTWRDGWRHLRFLLLYCPRWLFLYPGLAMTFVGGLGSGILVSGPVNIVSIGLDIHSLLFMSAILVIGVQLVQLALITQWMAVLRKLVPEPKWIELMRRWASLEVAILAAGALFIFGLLWSAHLVLDWSIDGFRELTPGQSMRNAIPAVVAMILGAQAGAVALFAAALRSIWPESQPTIHNDHRI